MKNIAAFTNLSFLGKSELKLSKSASVRKTGENLEMFGFYRKKKVFSSSEKSHMLHPYVPRNHVTQKFIPQRYTAIDFRIPKGRLAPNSPRNSSFAR